MPPHWSQGVLEDHGSRWAGQGITVDSRIAAGAPPRTSGNEAPNYEDDEMEEMAERVNEPRMGDEL